MSAAATITPLAASNSLTDLAGRIKTEHQAVAIALKGSIEHAIAAGELLIEAKAQIPHGGWLPWLRDHCNISERMAQRYVRLARNRAALEAKSDIVSDLSIGGALALLTVPKESNNPSDLLTVAAVETLSDSQDCEDALASIPEADRRKPLLAKATADLERIGELVRLSPALAVTVEAAGERLGDEFVSACRAYHTVVLDDQHGLAYDLARKIGNIASEWRRQVEAAASLATSPARGHA